MTYLITWLCLVLGGAVFQTIKYLFGLPFGWGALFNAAYWSGVALLLHAWANVRKPK